jgi:isocitrate dehydrogenase
MKTRIAVAKGDGIGPEIMDAVLRIFEAAEIPLEYSVIDMGKRFFHEGFTAGMTPEAKATIEQCGILFKGPMETPKGKGMNSINVTARKTWNTYANKRVFRTLPGVDTLFSRSGYPIDITIVRENIEDTYGGIEHLLTHDVALCRRFITRPGSLQVHRYAFEMARKDGSKKITCGHKANIMKITDGLFLECFYEVAKEYPDLAANDLIVDDLAMKLVVKPHDFDVIVLTNLQGDIISDLCAGLVGGLGFAPSANIGDQISIFEAVHGTAPDIAGRNLANPTALLMSSIMMLRHLSLTEQAARIENAMIATLETGAHTSDFGTKDKPPLTTLAFADEIISHLGKLPRHHRSSIVVTEVPQFRSPLVPAENEIIETELPKTEQICGVDYFVKSTQQPAAIAAEVKSILPDHLSLINISNRGTQVWPTGSFFTECVDLYQLRIETNNGSNLKQQEMLEWTKQLAMLMPVCSLEFLMSFDDKRGYSLSQGQ